MKTLSILTVTILLSVLCVCAGQHTNKDKEQSIEQRVEMICKNNVEYNNLTIQIDYFTKRMNECEARIDELSRIIKYKDARKIDATKERSEQDKVYENYNIWNKKRNEAIQKKLTLHSMVDAHLRKNNQ